MTAVTDRALIAQLVEGGLCEDAAATACDHVFGAIRALLGEGKSVGIPDVGRLIAPRKPAYVPGSCNRQAVEQRKVTLRHPAIIERGEPYAV